MCKYPHITAKLTDKPKAGIVVLGEVRRVLKRAGIPESEIQAYTNEINSSNGNMDALLWIAMQWVTVE